MDRCAGHLRNARRARLDLNDVLEATRVLRVEIHGCAPGLDLNEAPFGIFPTVVPATSSCRSCSFTDPSSARASPIGDHEKHAVGDHAHVSASSSCRSKTRVHQRRCSSTSSVFLLPREAPICAVWYLRISRPHELWTFPRDRPRCPEQSNTEGDEASDELTLENPRVVRCLLGDLASVEVARNEVVPDDVAFLRHVGTADPVLALQARVRDPTEERRNCEVRNHESRRPNPKNPPERYEDASSSSSSRLVRML